MPTFRVAGVQMAVSPALDENLPRILDHIKTIDADIVLFPEMSLTGYHGDFSDQAARAAWRAVATACRQHYRAAIVGTGCMQDGATYIQSRIYDGEGELLGTHEKIVPTSGDRDFCQPGHELRLFEYRGIPFGCLICNDMWVTPGCGPYPDPRLAYHLGRKGARIIFHAVNSGSSAVHVPYHESNLTLRAMESRVYIVTANAADPNGPVNCATGVVSPEGEWLVRCPRDGDQTFAYDLPIE
ncbi:MAG TPA: carbon-nitrogen hydrolase family protein [Candidatus Hydrogenedentes bacterium]|nr:carbon-nitrogen hydrolase family protein [Candidatus Hydrogenedentota bacterium]